MKDDTDSQFDKKPFERKHLDTENDIVAVRLNPEERAVLQRIKGILKYDSDSTILKMGLKTLLNVLLHSLGEENAVKIASQKRKHYRS